MTAVIIFIVEKPVKTPILQRPCNKIWGATHSVLEPMLLPLAASSPLAFRKLERAAAVTRVTHAAAPRDGAWVKTLKTLGKMSVFSCGEQQRTTIWVFTLLTVTSGRYRHPTATTLTAIPTPEGPLGMQAGPQADCTKNRNKTLQNSML